MLKAVFFVNKSCKTQPLTSPSSSFPPPPPPERRNSEENTRRGKDTSYCYLSPPLPCVLCAQHTLHTEQSVCHAVLRSMVLNTSKLFSFGRLLFHREGEININSWFYPPNARPCVFEHGWMTVRLLPCLEMLTLSSQISHIGNK